LNYLVDVVYLGAGVNAQAAAALEPRAALLRGLRGVHVKLLARHLTATRQPPGEWGGL
jgi:hypothetical protein